MILASLAIVLTLLAAGQDSVEMRGRVVSGPRAVISIPQLRVGTVAYESGAFKLRFRPRAECYELLITSVTNERKVLRFRSPHAGRLDLGDVTLPKRPGSSDFPDHWPLLADTVSACVPAKGPWPERWTAGHALVQATVSRGGRPLRHALIDVACPYTAASGRATTDSLGAFATDLTVTFPSDQTLVDGQAECKAWQATESIDPPWPVTIRFVPPEQPPIVNQIAWALPEPDFRASSVVTPAGDVSSPARLGNVVGFRSGVLGAFQFVRIALVPRPVATTLYRAFECVYPLNSNRTWGDCNMTLEAPDTRFREYLLPLAISVSTGSKRPTTGSGIYVNLPGQYAEAIDAGGVLEVYSRVPLRYTTDSTALVRYGASYNRSIHLLTFSFQSVSYDDQRSPAHEYEAMFLLAVRPQAVGPSRP